MSESRGRNYNAGIVTSATALSRLFGFIRISTIAYFFGASPSADVLNVLFATVQNLRKILPEGAFLSAIIPIINQKRQQKENINSFVRSLTSIIILTALIFCLLLFLGSPVITSLFFKFPFAFQRLLVLDLFRYLTLYFFFMLLSILPLALLHSYERFLASSLAPICFSVSIFLSLLLLSPMISVYSLILGSIIGAFLQLLLQLLALKRIPTLTVRPTFHIEWKDISVFGRRYFILCIPIFCPFITSIVMFRLASSLEVGSGSALSYALIFFNFPVGVFFHSIATVFFPEASRHIAEHNTKGFHVSLKWAFSQLLYLLIPSATFLFFFSEDIIRLVLERGEFSPTDTLLTASVLRYYVLSLPLLGLFQLFRQVGVLSKRYHVHLYLAISIMFVDTVLMYLLVQTPLKLVGIPVAHIIVQSFALVFVFWIYGRQFFAENCLPLFKNFLDVAWITTVCLVLSLLVRRFFLSHLEGSQTKEWLVFIASTLIFVFFGLLLYHLRGIKILSSTQRKRYN